jgi:hypothetical protein
MKKLILILFVLISWIAKGQDYQQLCLDCAEQNGFYCGDDPANWTQYSPNGCVPNGLNGLYYLNDGWEDCVDASDENGAVPTTSEECIPEEVPCDTVYVEIPVIEYDTIVDVQYVIDTVYIDIINWFPEYVDCVTMLPCNTGIDEILDKSRGTGIIYNLLGQPIRKPESIYIEDGKIKYMIN